MAISAATVFECRASGASDSNGGGFVAGSGGTDRSQQNSAQVAVGGGTVTSSITTTVVTFTGGTYTVLAGDIGNIVQFISGTNVTAGFYQITAVSAGLNGTWTLDRTPLTSGTTTNAVANMGGALATLSKLVSAYVDGNKGYATGAFTSTATITPTANGTPTTTTPSKRLIGYGATRGDSTHATLTLSTNTGLTGLNCPAGWEVEQIDVDCASLGTSTGISLGNFGEVRNCKISNFTTAGVTSGAVAVGVYDSEFTGGTSAAGNIAINLGGQSSAMRNFVHDNACIGINIANDSVTAFNLVVNNSGASSDGIRINYHSIVQNNTVHNNGRDGIRVIGGTVAGIMIRNNILSNNGGFGITGSPNTAIQASPDYDGNAFFSNTSGTRNLMDSTTGIFGVAPYTNVRDVTLSGSPYVGGTTGTASNFALNNTAGAGAACRAAASPGTWPGNTGTTGFLDMGAVQHQDSGGSSGALLLNPSLEGL